MSRNQKPLSLMTELNELEVIFFLVFVFWSFCSVQTSHITPGSRIQWNRTLQGERMLPAHSEKGENKMAREIYLTAAQSRQLVKLDTVWKLIMGTRITNGSWNAFHNGACGSSNVVFHVVFDFPSLGWPIFFCSRSHVLDYKTDWC